MVAIMSLPIERLAALFALAYVGLFVGLIAFTTNGPDATLQPADEMARAVSEGTAMRASALLGFAASIAFSGFATCLAPHAPAARGHARSRAHGSGRRSRRCDRRGVSGCVDHSSGGG